MVRALPQKRQSHRCHHLLRAALAACGKKKKKKKGKKGDAGRPNPRPSCKKCGLHHHPVCSTICLKNQGRKKKGGGGKKKKQGKRINSRALRPMVAPSNLLSPRKKEEKKGGRKRNDGLMYGRSITPARQCVPLL